jgi:hypothetical protein
LLTDKNQANLTIQGLEKNLNSTQAEFEKYQNTTAKAITQKDTKINELQIDLTKWLETFNNQTASEVKASQDKLASDLKDTQTNLEN